VGGDEGKSLAMTNNVSRFLGGSPATVLVRLIVVSFVVGIVLETFGLNAAMVFKRNSCMARDELWNSGLRTLDRLVASS